MSTLTGLGFFFFILKRRGLPGDSATIVRATASGSDGPAAAPELEVGIATSATHDETALAPDPPSDDGPAPDEVGVPRWLRGSLREGRIGRSTGRVRGWD